MKSVLDHYEKHLGPVYLWMIGDFDAALAKSAAELEVLELAGRRGAAAVDLGSGPGLHTIPLARLGYSVIAIDNCAALLKELERRAHPFAPRAIHADLLAFRDFVREPLAVLLCMGDTLTHLPDLNAVKTLFDAAAASLADDGVFAMSFRDYASAPLEGDRRFIPVRSDERRILTCFLEYGESTVTVHDLLHEHRDDQWGLKISSYPKLRISPDWVMAELAGRGLDARRVPSRGGMVQIAARRR